MVAWTVLDKTLIRTVISRIVIGWLARKGRSSLLILSGIVLMRCLPRTFNHFDINRRHLKTQCSPHSSIAIDIPKHFKYLSGRIHEVRLKTTRLLLVQTSSLLSNRRTTRCNVHSSVALSRLILKDINKCSGKLIIAISQQHIQCFVDSTSCMAIALCLFI